LLGYSDDQKEELTKINAKYAQDKNKQNRDKAIAILQSQVQAVRNVDGIPTGASMTAAEVLDFVRNYVAPNSRNKSLDRKVQDFRDMIYMFNSDPGMQNPEFEYVIGADMRKDKTGNSQEAENMSRMVPEFTAAARKLFNYNYDEKRGGVMRVEDYVREFGQDRNAFGAFETVKNNLVDTRGTMSGLVWTEHGAHIIVYTRNISDFIFTNTAGMLDQSLEYFLHSTQTSYGNKTYFDAAVERLTRPAYGRWEQQLLIDFKGLTDDREQLVNPITLYKSNYKDLTNGR
jgi:hypothetical protein